MARSAPASDRDSSPPTIRSRKQQLRPDTPNLQAVPYCAGAAAWILPHLVGRPLSLVRCPEGLAGDCFYAKQAWAGLSAAVRRIAVGEGHTALALDDLDGLLALVQGSVLEIHPWGSSLKDLERPDRLIFDLDP